MTYEKFTETLYNKGFRRTENFEDIQTGVNCYLCIEEWAKRKNLQNCSIVTYIDVSYHHDDHGEPFEDFDIEQILTVEE